MTKLLHKKISMLLICSLILVFSMAPTFADTLDNIWIVGDTFTQNNTLQSGQAISYTLNFKTEGTYRVTVSASGHIFTIFCDPSDSSMYYPIETLPNTTSSFDVEISDDTLKEYIVTCLCVDSSTDPTDLNLTIEKIE
ncbi:hypothetical protein [Fusibacter ferrireducens]|uniref:Uncharacterized protein n=1 Tax=Fusibacter ferrireducens TaxID=2785058 RepID=A0ABR9ZN40_9FIRM|nr:hypothetical protein [Fusibacter ferrireducens]MBF4691877.1 hypothetical protein [Fusibacter ferrireducens]